MYVTMEDCFYTDVSQATKISLYYLNGVQKKPKQKNLLLFGSLSESFVTLLSYTQKTIMKKQ